MNSAHDIGGIGLDRFSVGQPDQGLGGHVYQNIGIKSRHAFSNGLQVANITNLRCHHALLNARLFKERRSCRWCQRETFYVRAHVL
ncbi:hypothetical protein D3C84_940660 [compost metagenome]